MTARCWRPCGYTATQRYEATYKRLAPSWKGDRNEEIATLVGDLDRARAGGTAALKTFFDANFDVPRLRDYLVVTHWAAAWDDTVHNFLLYRFPAPPRKWIMLPWDFDVHIGGRDWPNGGPAGKANPPDVSFLLGKANEKGADVSRWKDSYYRVHEADYLTRLKELGATTLSPANVLQSVDEWGRAFSLKDFAADPTTKFCDPAANAESIKSWIVKRDAALKSRYP